MGGQRTLAQGLETLGGQRKYPRSPATTSFFLERKLSPGSLSKRQGHPVRLHTGRGLC